MDEACKEKAVFICRYSTFQFLSYALRLNEFSSDLSTNDGPNILKDE